MLSFLLTPYPPYGYTRPHLTHSTPSKHSPTPQTSPHPYPQPLTPSSSYTQSVLLTIHALSLTTTEPLTTSLLTTLHTHTHTPLPGAYGRAYDEHEHPCLGVRVCWAHARTEGTGDTTHLTHLSCTVLTHLDQPMNIYVHTDANKQKIYTHAYAHKNTYACTLSITHNGGSTFSLARQLWYQSFNG